MSATTRAAVRSKLLYRLEHKIGFTATEAKDLAAELMDKVETRLGSWKNIEEVRPFLTSSYNTLTEFAETINDQSFGISKKDLQRLIKKFNGSKLIRKVNMFVEKHKEFRLTKRVSDWEFTFTELKNDKESIKEQIILHTDKIRRAVARVGTSLREVKERLAARTFEASMRTITVMLQVAFNLITDNEVTIGPIPLGGLGVGSPTSIQLIEVAHSNKEVKFRAVGSIFLAHQLGGRDSVKITGKLTGSLKFLFLSLLWLLTLMSGGYVQQIDPESGNVTSLSDADITGGAFREGTGPITPSARIEDVLVESPSYIKHLRFPVVTTHEIIPNCYIETFSFEETLEGLKDTINYDILLRTYDEPREWISDAENNYFRAKRRTKTEHVLRYFINFSWRMLKYGKEYIAVDHNSWKTEKYFDVDAVDMGFAFAMAFMSGV